VKLEDAEDAFAHIAEVLALSKDEAERAAASHLRAHLLIKRGRYEEALTSAVGDAPALDEDRGIALSYLGLYDDADAALERAEARVATARDRVRVVSYRAINDYRRGDLERAEARYRAALALAEEHGLDDLVATCALNLGSVEHQRGELGPALVSYLRGQRLAAALGQSTALATLELDLAKLYADAGAFDRARTWIAHATERATAHELAFLRGACASVRGEIDLGEERWDDAEAALEAAARAFEATHTERERREVELTRARLDRTRGRLDAARERLRTTTDEAPDLAMRTAIELGLVELEAENAGAARAALDRAVSLSDRVRQPMSTARSLAARSRAWRALGATTLAETDRASARATYERIAAGLPAQLRDAFWRHPDRAGLELAATPTATPERERRLEQLLAINKKLGASLDVPDVLRSAMDAAIDLTGAERGFVLLDRDGELSVEIARNLDREKIGRSHLKFSRTIAEQVIASGEPVITVDALADARFSGNESVHAMKLRSVIAVPIPSPEGAVGALYLDNRFQRGRFERIDADTLLAFADQVAIALANARLHDELRRRTEELEAERARVLALSQGQAVQIEELQDRLRQQQRSLEHRYDYGALVARSPAMQPAISMLDRVIETPLTILVTGESGTGKELVARAAHFSSPRREGPFVSVNCAALPDALLESELFGHVRGAFTGAERDREGLMVAAERGTLFLDEIGETTLAMQAKLLRAIEERQVRPVGASTSRPVDFRLVCATNRDLRREAESGRFREDLYYRIGVIEVRLPPLRERAEDLPELTERLLANAAAALHRDPPRVSARAMRELMRQRWPGNVRELQNVLAAALVLCDGKTLEPEHLRFPKPRAAAPIKTRAERDERERARIMDALDATDWNASRAARQVGLSRATFYRKLAKYGVLRTRA
jgi:transcriptional regulator with GAF, ATPase, and Fis domain